MYRNGDVTAGESKNRHASACLWEKTLLKDDPNNVWLLIADLKKYPGADVKKTGSITPDMVSRFDIPAK